MHHCGLIGTPLDLFEDVKTGTLLASLLEALHFPKRMPFKIHYEPKSCFEQLENLRNCLDFLEAEGVKLINISAEDLLAGKPDLVLGLTWSLILQYGAKDGLRQAELALWVREVAAAAALHGDGAWSGGAIKWESALCDGHLFLAMSAPHRAASLPSGAVGRLKAAFAAGLRRGAPRLLDAADVAEGRADTHSLLAYVSLLRDAMGAAGAAVVLQRVARGRAGRARGLKQRDRMVSILRDEEQRWQGRVSAAEDEATGDSIRMHDGMPCTRPRLPTEAEASLELLAPREDALSEPSLGMTLSELLRASASASGSVTQLNSGSVTQLKSPNKRSRLLTWPSITLYPRVWDFGPSTPKRIL